MSGKYVAVVVLFLSIIYKVKTASESPVRLGIPYIEDVSDAVRCVHEAAGKVWTMDNVRRGVALRRAVREVGQAVWDMPLVLSSFTSLASIVSQMVSFLPDVSSVAVQVLATGLYLVGNSVEAAGSGLSLGSRAVEHFGRSLTSLSNILPRIVSLLVVSGISAVLLVPGFYDSIMDVIASVGLTLAGQVSTTMRGFVHDNTHFATLLDTASLFLNKLQQNSSL